MMTEALAGMMVDVLALLTMLIYHWQRCAVLAQSWRDGLGQPTPSNLEPSAEPARPASLAPMVMRSGNYCRDAKPPTP